MTTNSGQGNHARLSVQIVESGEYFIRVHGATTGTKGEYTLRVASSSIVEFDFNQDGRVDDQDIDLLARGKQSNDLRFDITGDQVIDIQDLEFLVESVLETNIGDSNLDGVFNSSDLLLAFQAGQYEDSESKNSTWKRGDWNGDSEFDTRDLVFAFQKGSYVASAISSVSVDDDTLHDLASTLSFQFENFDKEDARKTLEHRRVAFPCAHERARKTSFWAENLSRNSLFKSSEHNHFTQLETGNSSETKMARLQFTHGDRRGLNIHPVNAREKIRHQ